MWEKYRLLKSLVRNSLICGLLYSGAVFGAECVFEWDHPAPETITTYKLYKGTQSGVYTSFDLSAAQIYTRQCDQGEFYTVSAVNQMGFESEKSNEVEIPKSIKPGNLRVIIQLRVE